MKGERVESRRRITSTRENEMFECGEMRERTKGGGGRIIIDSSEGEEEGAVTRVK